MLTRDQLSPEEAHAWPIGAIFCMRPCRERGTVCRPIKRLLSNTAESPVFGAGNAQQISIILSFTCPELGASLNTGSKLEDADGGGAQPEPRMEACAAGCAQTPERHISVAKECIMLGRCAAACVSDKAGRFPPQRWDGVASRAIAFASV